jgi:hypothetical protein
MGSYLHIGKLPYSDKGTVAEYNNIKLQFTNGIEIILSIEELEILLKSLFFKKHLYYRERVELLNECNDLLNEEDRKSVIDLMITISRYIGYHSRNFNIENQDILESLHLLKTYNELSKPDKKEDIRIISDIINWANKYFIEGEHYFYTV